MMAKVGLVRQPQDWALFGLRGTSAALLQGHRETLNGAKAAKL